MSSEAKNIVPQAGDSPAVGSDRVQAPVAGAGPMDSGGGHAHSRLLRGVYMERRQSEPSMGDALRSIPRRVEGGTKRKIGDISQNYEEAYKKKECSEVFILNEAIEQITRLVGKLGKKIERNTQREIKEIADQLSIQIKSLNKDIVINWLENNKYEKTEKMVYDADVQTDTKRTRDMGIQTGNQGEMVNLGGVDSYANFCEIERLVWDDANFRNTEIQYGDILMTDSKTVKVIMVKDEDLNMEGGLVEKFKRKYPELMDCEETMAVVERMCLIKTETGQRKTGQKIIKLVLSGRAEEIWEGLKKIRKETEEEECVAIHSVGGMEEEKLKKMVEAVFHGGRTKVVIFRDGREEKGIKKKTYALMVEKTANENVESMVEKIKKSVKDKRANREITGLRSTRLGEILVTMGSEEESAMEVREAIQKELMTRVWVMGPRKKKVIVVIRGMDITTTRDEVEEAIRERVKGLKKWEFTVGSMRGNIGDTLCVSVTMEESRARELLRRDWLRVGYVNCRIERRLDIERCYKCWGMGHQAEVCNGEDRKGCCFGCGKEGHRRRECKEEERCVACGLVGHRTGSGKCDEFRRALAKARESWRRERDASPPEGGDLT